MACLSARSTNVVHGRKVELPRHRRLKPSISNSHRRLCISAGELQTEGPLDSAAIIYNGSAPSKALVPRNQGPDYTTVTRNLALELVRVTEAAALESARWSGKGDKEAADQAAVDAMRHMLASISMDGIVVIGEGEKDEAPMLYCGERIGDGRAPLVDIAVDPLDGTTLTAQGRNGAVSVIALASRDSLFDPGPCVYMDKLAVGSECANAVHIERSVGENIRAVGLALNKPVDEVTVVVLDRPRHEGLIQQCREAGARVRLISDGDVAGAIAVAQPHTGLDILLGIGGTPEGVIAACALKCMGGAMQGKLHPRNPTEAAAAVSEGFDLERVLYTNDLVSSDEVFFAATGVTDGDLLSGVKYNRNGGGATTHSIVMRNKSQTVRVIQTYHKWEGNQPNTFDPTIVSGSW